MIYLPILFAVLTFVLVMWGGWLRVRGKASYDPDLDMLPVFIVAALLSFVVGLSVSCDLVDNKLDGFMAVSK